MGKGQIVSGGTDGQYSVKLLYDRTKSQAALDQVNRWITMKEEQIDKYWYSNPEKLPALKLALESLKKWKAYYESIPEDPTVDAWCADLSEDLTGEVATVEINGEPDQVLVRPGYTDQAAFDMSRDGQLQHIKAMTPEQWFYNAAMAPGWKKWMPTYRVGEITKLDADKCDVLLDDATTEIINAGSQSINATMTHEDIDIEYMDCNGEAFEVGDRVVVEYRDRSPSGENKPVVIGFETEPKPCGQCVIISGRTPTEFVTILWDCSANDYSSNGYWMDNAGKKHKIAKTEYPFVSLISDGDPLAEWKARYECKGSLMYRIQTKAPEYPTEEDLTFDRLYDIVTSPSGLEFKAYHFHNGRKIVRNTPIAGSELFGTSNTREIISDREPSVDDETIIDHTEHFRVGGCVSGKWEPYNPSPIRNHMDGEWFDWYEDGQGVACDHRAWKWDIALYWVVKTRYVSIFTYTYVGFTYLYTDGNTWLSSGNSTTEIRYQFVPDIYCNGNNGYQQLEMSAGMVRQYVNAVYEVEAIYKKQGATNPLGTAFWEYRTYHEESRGTPAEPFKPMRAEGDCDIFSSVNYNMANDQYAVQVYVDRKYESNVFAQSAKREKPTSPFTAARNSKFEGYIKDFLSVLYGKIDGGSMPWNVNVSLSISGIWGKKQE